MKSGQEIGYVDSFGKLQVATFIKRREDNHVDLSFGGQTLTNVAHDPTGTRETTWCDTAPEDDEAPAKKTTKKKPTPASDE